MPQSPRVDVIIDPTGDHHVSDKRGIFNLNVSSLFRFITGVRPPARPTELVRAEGHVELHVVDGGEDVP